MKYLLLSLLSLLLSCSYNGHIEVVSLLQADSLIQAGRADSALILLESMPPEVLVTSASQARYALLLTQARDKEYIHHTNDSLIRIAVDYYDATDDMLSRSKAHYYLGRVYQDMNDIEGTVREFLSAIPLAEKVDDYKLTCMLQSNLGYLFWVNGLLNEADSLYKRAVVLAQEKQDTLRLALALSNLSDIYLEEGVIDYFEVENYLNQALSIMKNQKNVFVKRRILFSLAFLYERMGKLPETISVAQRVIVLQPDTTEHHGAYYLIGSAYYKMGKYDSATYYLNKCFVSDDYAVRENAYMCSADIANKQGRLKDALFYESYHHAYKDSVRLRKQPVEVATISKDILHQQIVGTYRSSLNQYRYYLILIGILSSFTVLFLFKKRIKEKRTMYLLKVENKKCNLHLNQLQQALDKKKGEIEMWKIRYSECEGDRDQQCQINNYLNELLEEKRLLCLENDMAIKDRERQIEKLENNNFRNLIIKTDIYKRIQTLKKQNKATLEKNKLTDADWDDLEVEFNHIIPRFLKHLNEHYDALLKKDIQFCCLLKIGFNYTDIQYILGCAPDTVYKRDKAIKQRMNIEQSVKLKDIIDEI